MNKHIELFYNVSNIIRFISLSKDESKSQNYPILLHSLETWEKLINKLSQDERDEFIELHYEELRLVKKN